VNGEHSDRAILCDMCETWYHVSCDPLISDAQNDSFVHAPTEDPWFCSKCTQISDTPVLPTGLPADKKLKLLTS